MADSGQVRFHRVAILMFLLMIPEGHILEQRLIILYYAVLMRKKKPAVLPHCKGRCSKGEALWQTGRVGISADF
jgi:hypothetical protein